MNASMRLGGPIAVGLCLTGGCAVGLAAHPLTDAQAAAMQPRPAPVAAQSIDGMTSVVVRVPIDAAPGHVWEQLAVRYGDVHRWSGPIADSGMEAGHVQGGQGAVRSCTLGPSSPVGKGETFSETIVHWDPEQRFFAAGVDNGFYPMRQVIQEYWVDARPDGGTVVTTQFSFDLSFPMGKGKRLVSRLRPQVVTSLLGLKHLVERGDAQQAQDADFLARTYPAVYDANGAG